jgi:predicted SAM-dependent methyltransferase
MKKVKTTIKKILHLMGYDLMRAAKSRDVDLNLYSGYPAESIKEKRFYNIGAAGFCHPYWTNIDLDTDHYRQYQKKAFINYDLMALLPLPIDSNSAEIVYSSHTIEHVTDEAAYNMFSESYRVLKKGGCIRITCPNARLEYDAYKRNDINFWYWRKLYSEPGTWEKIYRIPLSQASIQQVFLHHFASQISEIDVNESPAKKYSDKEITDIFLRYPMEEAFDYFTTQCKFDPVHPGNHISWWTHEKLISFLRKAGFSGVYPSAYQQSSIAPLRDSSFFDNTHPELSLYVEAIK